MFAGIVWRGGSEINLPARKIFGVQLMVSHMAVLHLPAGRLISRHVTRKGIE
jgi:hypothetical protein